MAEFQITAKLKNDSDATVKDYHLDVQVPLTLLENDSALHTHELLERRTTEYRFFRFPHRDSRPSPIYPGDEKAIGTITSYLTSAQVNNPQVRQLNYVATLYADSRKIITSKSLDEIFKMAKAGEFLPRP